MTVGDLVGRRGGPSHVHFVVVDAFGNVTENLHIQSGPQVMSLKAIIRSVTGGTIHRLGPAAQALPHPASVEIEEGDGGFYLFRLDSSGKCISDTWHESLERAKAQARFEYKIGEEDWGRGN